jgi:hypothetical protein
MEKELRIQQEQKMEQKPKNRARTISAASLTKQTIHKQQQFAWAEQVIDFIRNLKKS